jgi:hypothetical protein
VVQETIMVVGLSRQIRYGPFDQTQMRGEHTRENIRSRLLDLCAKERGP